MLRRKTAVISGIAGLALAGSLAGGIAYADSSSPSASTSTSASANANANEGDGAKALCKRAPKLEARIEKALTRLNAAATKKGSVAYLQERVQDAQAKGDTAIATYLNDNLTARKALIGTLQQRETDLKAVQASCK